MMDDMNVGYTGRQIRWSRKHTSATVIRFGHMKTHTEDINISDTLSFCYLEARSEIKVTKTDALYMINELFYVFMGGNQSFPFGF